MNDQAVVLIASSIPTLLGLACLGAAAAGIYVYLLRRSRPRPPATAPRRAEPAPRPAPGPVAIRSVIEAMAAAGDDETPFLDRSTGRIVTIGDETLAEIESEEPEDAEDLADDVADLRRKLRGRVLLALPTKAETKEFLLRERFCDELPEGEAREQMLKVMRAQTGFRSFDAAVRRLGVEQQWQRLRDGAFADVAVAWLERHGIAWRRDADVPPAPDALAA